MSARTASAASTSNSSLRALSVELKSLLQEPVEGFRVKLPNEDNLYEWEVAIFGPPGTLYEGAYFKVYDLQYIRKIYAGNI